MLRSDTGAEHDRLFIQALNLEVPDVLDHDVSS